MRRLLAFGDELAGAFGGGVSLFDDLFGAAAGLAGGGLGFGSGGFVAAIFAVTGLNGNAGKRGHNRAEEELFHSGEVG